VITPVISICLSVCVCVCVCVRVCLSVRALTVAILTDFDEIWHRHLKPDAKEPFHWGVNIQ